MEQSWCKKSNKKGDRFGSSASHRAPLNPPLLTLQSPINSVTLHMSGAGGGSHTTANVSSLKECKWRVGDAEEVKKYFNLSWHAESSWDNMFWFLLPPISLCT